MLRDLFPSDTAESVWSIDYQKLYDLGYRLLLFDIDNTLVHHGDDSTPEVDALFGRIHAIGLKTFILSNNNEERILRFLKNIDSRYMEEAGKPAPACYHEACRIMGVPEERTVMVGDQLFTDIRGANLAGIDSILVHYITTPGRKWPGWHRCAEYLILGVFRLRRQILPGKAKDLTGNPPGERKPAHLLRDLAAIPGGTIRFLRGEILFCEISPLAYRLSLNKEILLRKLKDLRSGERFATDRKKELLPFVAAVHKSNMIRRAPGIDLTLQQNKAVNIALASRTMNHLVIHPGETFSFWKRVGPTTPERGFKDGRVIKGGRLVPGPGGGLCNLANTLHLLVLDSPLKVTELHFHSDALAPDEGPRHPMSSGTSVSYNNIDFRFTNPTDQDFQIVSWCEGEMHYAQLRCGHEFPYTYKLVEEDHHFTREGDSYYRVSKIYRETYDRATGRLLSRDLLRDNHSEVMYDPAYIPRDLLRE